MIEKASQPNAHDTRLALTPTMEQAMTEATQTLPHPQQRPHPSARGMQRRHFELIAEIISKELNGEYREKAAYAFAYILPITNANFDSQRFLKACKVSAFTEGDNQ